MHTKSQYIAKMKLELNLFDGAVNEYESIDRQLPGDAQLVYQDNLFRMRQQCALIREKIEQIQGSDEIEWDEVFMEADCLRAVFIESFKTLRSRL